MEDLVNFNSASRSAFQTSSQQSLSTLTCAPNEINHLPPVLLFDSWATIGIKRQIPEEPFSAKKRRKDGEDNVTSINMESNNSSTLTNAPKTPSSSKKSHDRFIPNRSGLDIDYNFYQLTKPQETQNDVKLTPSQRKLKDELDHIKSGDKRRLVECRSTLTPQFERVATPLRVSAYQELQL